MYIHFDTCQIYIYNIYVYVYVYSACGLSGRSWPCAGLRRVRWNAPMALDCAECAGMRRLGWNALESTDCAFAPNCADCAELRRFAPIALFAPNCAGILPAAWHTANTTLWLSQPGCDLGFAACSFRAVPVVPGVCGSLLAAVPAVLRFFFSFQSER